MRGPFSILLPWTPRNDDHNYACVICVPYSDSDPGHPRGGKTFFKPLLPHSLHYRGKVAVKPNQCHLFAKLMIFEFSI